MADLNLRPVTRLLTLLFHVVLCTHTISPSNTANNTLHGRHINQCVYVYGVLVKSITIPQANTKNCALLERGSLGPEKAGFQSTR